MNSIQREKFVILANKAHHEGMLAGQAVKPKGMLVHGKDEWGIQKIWEVPEGLCGFACIRMDARSAFAKFLLREGMAKRGYEKGIVIYVHQFNQSWERKAAYAAAYAKVLQQAEIPGVTWEERLD